MDLKTELIALAVRHLSARKIISKPDTIQDFISVITTGKTYDVRLAEDIVASADKAVASAQRFRTNRQFKKITENV